MEEVKQCADLGEITMVPTGEQGPTETVELQTPPAEVVVEEKPKNKGGRPKGSKTDPEKLKKQAEAKETALKAETPAEVQGTDSKEADGGDGQDVEAQAMGMLGEFFKQVPRSTIDEAIGSLTGGPELGVFQLRPGSLPEQGTEQSAGFDVRANFGDLASIDVYSSANRKVDTAVRDNYGVKSVILTPGARALIPTGLVLDIPVGYKVSLYPRSGLSLKQGLNLANGVAVIDSDYVNELFIIVKNNSELRAEINNGDRLAQLELVPVQTFRLKELTEAPSQKTDRAGGMGSTGVQ